MGWIFEVKILRGLLSCHKRQGKLQLSLHDTNCWQETASGKLEFGQLPGCPFSAPSNKRTRLLQRTRWYNVTPQHVACWRPHPTTRHRIRLDGVFNCLKFGIPKHSISKLQNNWTDCKTPPGISQNRGKHSRIHPCCKLLGLEWSPPSYMKAYTLTGLLTKFDALCVGGPIPLTSLWLGWHSHCLLPIAGLRSSSAQCYLELEVGGPAVTTAITWGQEDNPHLAGG